MNRSDDVVIDILHKRDGGVTSLEAWLIFKKLILDNRIIRKSSKEFAIQSAISSIQISVGLTSDISVWRGYFNFFWNVTLDDNLPFVVDDDESYGGLKLKSKGDVTIEHLNIQGFLFPVTDEEYARLVEVKYYSIFEGDGVKSGILYGPLSLINHSCSADWFFPNPTKTTRKYNVLEKDILYWTKLKSHKFEVNISDRQELLVNYFPDGSRPACFDCKCAGCVCR